MHTQLLLSIIAELWMGLWLAVMSETNHVVEEVIKTY